MHIQSAGGSMKLTPGGSTWKIISSKGVLISLIGANGPMFLPTTVRTRNPSLMCPCARPSSVPTSRTGGSLTVWSTVTTCSSPGRCSSSLPPSYYRDFRRGNWGKFGQLLAKATPTFTLPPCWSVADLEKQAIKFNEAVVAALDTTHPLKLRSTKPRPFH